MLERRIDPVGQLNRLEIPLEASQRKASLGRWPYVFECTPLPDALPSGRPWPKISIVTPSYNQGQFIEETILSVLHQGYPNLEHIVIDGGSTDTTQDVLNRFENKLAYVVSEPDDGQSHAINKGMAQATGEILTWLNSDDMLAPGALAAVAMAFDTSDADMVAGACTIFQAEQCDRNQIPSCEEGPLPLREILDLEAGWGAGRFFFQPEVMFRRELWQRAGGRLREDLRYVMDYELWVRFAEHGARLHVIGRPVAWFRRHDDQKTNEQTGVKPDFRIELEQFRDQYVNEKRDAFVQQPVLPARKTRLRIVVLGDRVFRGGAGAANRRIGEVFAWAGHRVIPIGLINRTSELNAEFDLPVEEIVRAVANHGPDLVIVGNLHAARCSPSLVEELGRRWPCAVILHDFWWLTGRCTYTAGCQRLLRGCDETCPTPAQYPSLAPNDIAPAWQTKRAILGGDHAPLLLALSDWTAGSARQVLGADQGQGFAVPKVETFRIGLPTDIFRPRDMAACRARFDLPNDKFIVMTVGAVKADDRKGMKDIAKALSMVDIPDLLVVSAGWPGAEKEPAIPGARQTGYLKGEEDMALLYGAADIFVGASREETFGLAFIEAAACGTPVVAYDGTGVAEAVKNGVTGINCQPGEPAALARAIERLWRDPLLRRRIRAWAPVYIENEFSYMRSYYTLVRALERAGLADRILMKTRINLRGAAPRLNGAEMVLSEAPWEPVYGFGRRHGSRPARNLDSFHRIVRPSAELSFSWPETGPASALLELDFRNKKPGQELKVFVNHKLAYTVVLHAKAIEEPQKIAIETRLRPGKNALVLNLSDVSGAPQDDRIRGALLNKFRATPLAGKSQAGSPSRIVIDPKRLDFIHSALAESRMRNWVSDHAASLESEPCFVASFPGTGDGWLRLVVAELLLEAAGLDLQRREVVSGDGADRGPGAISLGHDVFRIDDILPDVDACKVPELLEAQQQLPRHVKIPRLCVKSRYVVEAEQARVILLFDEPLEIIASHAGSMAAGEGESPLADTQQCLEEELRLVCDAYVRYLNFFNQQGLRNWQNMFFLSHALCSSDPVSTILSVARFLDLPVERERVADVVARNPLPSNVARSGTDALSEPTKRYIARKAARAHENATHLAEQSVSRALARSRPVPAPPRRRR